MNLSARERQALRSIEGGLTESDPDLVAKLATLSRLMADEDRPAAKRSRAGWRHVVIGSLVRWLPGSRGHGHTSTQSWWGSAMLALWLAMTCALIATAAALSHVGTTGSCAGLMPVSCGSHAPAQPSPHGGR